MIDADEIKQRIDIVDYISRYTPLKKAGRQYKGICPFHTEKTPSFYVYPDQGSWHCYGACSTGGDVISFLMKKENLSFLDAVQILGREAGVDVSLSGGEHAVRNRDTLYELNAVAGEYFASLFRDSPTASGARDYIERRGIDAEIIEQFGIGFAPDGWNGLRDHLSDKGYDFETQLLAGAIKRHEERGTYYDVFRNRVIVPIRDHMSRIIGFGGRVLDDSQPKYLNTPDTPVFHKSRVVYGIDVARDSIRDTGSVVIVEGYMDVIAAHQYGFDNVVACMGTALTTEQLRLIQRYTRKFVFALDADSAGQQATIRGLNQARQGLSRVKRPAARPGGGLRLEERLGAELLIASMPAGMDPDDVIRSDPEEWRRLLDGAQPLVDFFFSMISEQFDLTSANGKGAAVSALAPLIAELADDIEQQHYIQQLSRLVAIDELMIANRVKASSTTNAIPVNAQHRPPQRRRNVSLSPPPGDDEPWLAAGDAPENVGTASQPVTGALEQEDYLLALLLQQPDSVIWMTTRALELDILPPVTDDWKNIENQEIYRALKLHLSGDEQWDVEVFQEDLAEPLHGRLGRLLTAAAVWPEYEVDELRSDLLKVLVRIRIDHLKSDNVGIKFAIDEAQRAGDQVAVRSFDATNNRNLRELNHLQSTLADLTRVLAAQGRMHQGVRIR